MSAFGEKGVGGLNQRQVPPNAGDAHDNGPPPASALANGEKPKMTESEAVAWIAELFEEQASRLAPHTTRNEIPAWDSLGILTLIASLDSDFGIVLEDGEIAGLKKVNDILDLFRRSGQLA